MAAPQSKGVNPNAKFPRSQSSPPARWSLARDRAWGVRLARGEARASPVETEGLLTGISILAVPTAAGGCRATQLPPVSTPAPPPLPLASRPHLGVLMRAVSHRQRPGSWHLQPISTTSAVAHVAVADSQGGAGGSGRGGPRRGPHGGRRAAPPHGRRVLAARVQLLFQHSRLLRASQSSPRLVVKAAGWSSVSARRGGVPPWPAPLGDRRAPAPHRPARGKEGGSPAN